MALLLVIAVLGWVVVQRVFAKPLGASCRNDMDCGSLTCLQSVAFGYAGAGAATCTRTCSSDGDCPTGFECKTVRVVVARAHAPIPAGTQSTEASYCLRR